MEARAGQPSAPAVRRPARAGRWRRGKSVIANAAGVVIAAMNY
jgi:hypothetical protein